MINSKEVLYTSGKNDECYTPSYAVEPILKYIPKDWVVWCPCDTDESEFVKLIKANGNKVISSHIFEGKDFLTHLPTEHWDCIITNPPFTNKRAYFERALELGKPFAILMTLTIFNDKYPMWSFKERGVTPQLLKFDKRVEFVQKDSNNTNKITFQSGYICRDFLTDDFILEELCTH